MSTIQVTDIPQSLKARIVDSKNDSVSFAVLEWVYRDGMDWVQYDEVLATNQDKAAHDRVFGESSVADDTVTFLSLDEAFD